ncbi:MAG: hypothetical protein ABJF10_10930 [Chthoniobacter sp.]|uniref:hypothetical protein n=1 Tax=Chthoniobacter sp. TaxID=2510640 RepID=UPI0032A88145
MNGTEPTLPPNTIDILQLARAIRFALVSIVLGLSYFSLRVTLTIEGFEQIFRDMLGGRALPWLTVLILRGRLLFLGVSILVPTLAIGSLFNSQVVRSFYLIGGLGLLTVLQFVVLYHGLTAPLLEIIKAMGGNP